MRRLWLQVGIEYFQLIWSIALAIKSSLWGQKSTYRFMMRWAVTTKSLTALKPLYKIRSEAQVQQVVSYLSTRTLSKRSRWRSAPFPMQNIYRSKTCKKFKCPVLNTLNRNLSHGIHHLLTGQEATRSKEKLNFARISRLDASVSLGMTALLLTQFQIWKRRLTWLPATN
jgi:hypothetical protein